MQENVRRVRSLALNIGDIVYDMDPRSPIATNIVTKFKVVDILLDRDSMRLEIIGGSSAMYFVDSENQCGFSYQTGGSWYKVEPSKMVPKKDIMKMKF